MRHLAKVMLLAMALSVTTAMVPQAIAQTPPRRRRPCSRRSNPRRPSNPRNRRNPSHNRAAKVRLIGLRVRPPAPQLEPSLATRPPARSSELGIPAARRDGTTGRTSRERVRAGARADLLALLVEPASIGLTQHLEFPPAGLAASVMLAGQIFSEADSRRGAARVGQRPACVPA
jgi:hypothetical protein